MPSGKDTLLEALKSLGRFHSKTVNADSATSGLPLHEGKLTPELFIRAAERCGLASKLVKRDLGELHEATLPAVLIMKNGQAAVLHARDDKMAQFEMPGLPDPEQIVPIKQVKDYYSGYAILTKPIYRFERRSSFGDEGKKEGHWFWGTLLRFKGFYARVAVATVAINFLALASSLFVMNVYDRVVPNKAVDTLIALAAGVLIAYLFEFTLKSLRTYFLDRAGHRADVILGSKLFEKILSMKFQNVPASGGALAGQARAYEVVREFFASATIAALVDLPFVLMFIAIIYMLGGVVALPLLIGAVLTVLTGLFMQIPISRSVKSGYQAGNQRYALFVESVSAMETVKATRSESELQARMEDCVHQSAKAERKSKWYSQTALNLTALMQNLVSMAIIVTAFFQVTQENMTMGAMIACVILAGRAMAPLSMVASLMTRIQQSRQSLEGLNRLMESPTERDRGGNVSVPNFVPSVAVRDLCFRYNEDSPEILRGLNLTIRPGEKVALLGKIGSGKSTLLRMIMALYEPTAGRIEVSGIENRQIDPTELRRNIGYVSQDSTLLFGTLRSNLTAGLPHADDGMIWKAVERVGLADFVRSHPRGLEMEVAEGGRSLSGGQRQAVCAARALMEEPDLLVMDEPTSAMDMASEKQLMACLSEYIAEKPGRTVIVATHKRAILMLVDRAIVVDNGLVIADGPKEQIIKGVRGGDTSGPVHPQTVLSSSLPGTEHDGIRSHHNAPSDDEIEVADSPSLPSASRVQIANQAQPFPAPTKN